MANSTNVGKNKKKPAPAKRKAAEAAARNRAAADALLTVAAKAPVTSERKVRADLDTKLDKPYLARALAAPDTKNVHGSWGHEHKNKSVLQQHVAFFDTDNNGVIFPWESFIGFRDVGFSVLATCFLTILVHLAMGFVTSPSFIPSPFCPIYIRNIHKMKHGSDSGTYDTEGRFVPANLENIFSKYALTRPDNLTLKEIWHMTNSNRRAFDFFGWCVSKVEWVALYMIAKDSEGFLSKESVRSCFDGSLFKRLAKLQKGDAVTA